MLTDKSLILSKFLFTKYSLDINVCALMLKVKYEQSSYQVLTYLSVQSID